MGSTGEGLGRRDLIKRSAALGLITVPTMSFLSACASGGEESTKGPDKGVVSKENPFGLAKGGKLDVVVFKGGFGDDYAKAWEAAFDKKWGTTTSHLATQEITAKLQPRFNGGNPPDVVDDSGAQKIPLDVLAKEASSPTSTPCSTRPRSTTRPRRCATPWSTGPSNRACRAESTSS